MTEEEMLDEIEDWLLSLSVSKLFAVFNSWTEGIDSKQMIENIMMAVKEEPEENYEDMQQIKNQQ